MKSDSGFTDREFQRVLSKKYFIQELFILLLSRIDIDRWCKIRSEKKGPAPISADPSVDDYLF